MSYFELSGASVSSVISDDDTLSAFLRSFLPGLPLPDDLKNYSIIEARIEFTKNTTIRLTHPKDPNIAPKFIKTKPYPYKEVVMLPEEVNEKLTKFARVYLACRFTKLFLQYIKNPKNRVLPIVGTTTEFQEKLVSYRDNPANMPFLDFRIKDAEKYYQKELTINSSKPDVFSKQLNFELSPSAVNKFAAPLHLDMVRAGWFIQDTIQKCEAKLKEFFSQQKIEILRQSGYKEIEITPENMLNQPRVRAMLDMLVYAEGTGAGYGTIVKGTVINAPFNPELVGKTNVTVTDFSRHPQIDVLWRKGEKTSSGAGRYQILYPTWKGYGGDAMDFSPRSQDIVAVKEMMFRKMIVPLLNGDARTAIHAGAKEWMSLPMENGKSYKNQPVKNIEDLLRVYNQALSTYQK